MAELLIYAMICVNNSLLCGQLYTLSIVIQTFYPKADGARKHEIFRKPR